MNLLQNPNFDEGHHHQDNIPEIVVPNGWQLYWIDKQIFKGAEQMAYRPESVVWNINSAPEHEKPLFFLNGTYCWKIFKAHAPVYFAATQAVAGLVPGARYRFVANVHPDIVVAYRDGKKQYPTDIWAAEMRVGWSAPGTPWPQAEDGAVSWSEWFNMHNQNFVCGKYNQMTLEFVAPLDGQARVWVEGKCKWGYSNNWFMDAFALEAVETVGMPAPAPNPPVPPPSDALRLYFLLPETLAPELAMAALWVAQELRATVGFSPDDAGAGGPRRVIGVLPAQSGAWLDQTWYAQRYPGVQYVTLNTAADANELMARLRALATAVG